MTPLLWMMGSTLATWLAVTLATGNRLNPELLAGMVGPLVSAALTWIAVARTHAANPARLPGVMMAGFALKMVGFGAYAVVALGPLGLRPLPFIASFTAYFIALHALEAVFLRRLSVPGARTPALARETVS